MRFHQFDLNLLIYLDALLSEKSVSKAAERVNITQPAMSEALSRLREFYKDELLVHVAGRHMILTPLAQSLAMPVRSILLDAQSVVTATAEFIPAKSNRRFRIEIGDYVFDVLFQKVLGRLHIEAPNVKVDLHRITMDHSRERIKRAEIDLLIGPTNFLAENLPNELLYQDPLTCVVWSGNRIVGKTISFEQYMELGHVCQVNGAYHQWFVGRFGHSRNVEVGVPDFKMIFPAIQGTQRIAALYLKHAQMYQKQFSLRLLKPPVDFPPLEEYMQWHPHQDKDPGLAWLRNQVKCVATEI